MVFLAAERKHDACEDDRGKGAPRLARWLDMTYIPAKMSILTLHMVLMMVERLVEANDTFYADLFVPGCDGS